MRDIVCDVSATDNRTGQLLGVLQDITDHYQDTLESLRMINETLGGVQEMVDGMNSAIHSQLDWVVGQLGGANQGLRCAPPPYPTSSLTNLTPSQGPHQLCEPRPLSSGGNVGGRVPQSSGSR